jgi:hypothetical protein
MSNSSNNVVVFPKTFVQSKEHQQLEDIQHNLDMMKHYHIQETITNLAPLIFNQLDIAGFGLTEDIDEDIKDGAFIVESLRSIMCKHYDIYHPFQVIAENVFEENKKDPEGAYRIVDKLELDLTEPEEIEEDSKE